MTLNQKERGELFSLREHGPLTLCCRRGQLWVTRAGEGDDVVLAAGETLRLPANPHTLIQALSAAEFELCRDRALAA